MATRRFTRANPCPICEGWDDRSIGERRCWGAIFDDERVVCTRVESKVATEIQGGAAWVHFLNERGPRDIHPATSPHRPKDPPKPWPAAFDRDIEAIYRYEKSGELVYEVVRRAGKKIMPRHWNSGQWMAGYGVEPQTETVLYFEDEAIQALAAGDTLYIVEGEKDADSVRRVGCAATTNPGGTGLGFRTHHAEALASVESDARIVIVADRDGPGYKHAAKVRELLVRAGVLPPRVSIRQAREGKDATDHLEAGFQLEQLVDPPAGAIEPLEAGGDPLVRRLENGPQLVDIAGGLLDPPPRAWIFEDWLPRGISALMVAEGGTGKGYFQVQMALSLSLGISFGPWKPNGPTGVLMLSREDDDDELHRRFNATVKARFGEHFDFKLDQLGHIERNLHLRDLSGIEPCEFGPDFNAAVAAFCANHPGIGVIFVDPLAKFMPADAPEFNSQEGAGFVSRQLDALRVATGCTVIGVHHTKKGADQLDANAATGSRQLVDYARWVLNLTRLDVASGAGADYGLDPDKGPYVVAKVTKSNYTMSGDATAIVLQVGRGGALVPHLTTRMQKALTDSVLTVIVRAGRALTRKEIHEELRLGSGLSLQKAEQAVRAAERDGLIKRASTFGKHGRGPNQPRFELADTGLSRISDLDEQPTRLSTASSSSAAPASSGASSESERAASLFDL